MSKLCLIMIRWTYSNLNPFLFLKRSHFFTTSISFDPIKKRKFYSQDFNLLPSELIHSLMETQYDIDSKRYFRKPTIEMEVETSSTEELIRNFNKFENKYGNSVTNSF